MYLRELLIMPNWKEWLGIKSKNKKGMIPAIEYSMQLLGL